MSNMSSLRYIVGLVRAGQRITGVVLATPSNTDTTPDVLTTSEINSYLLRNKATLVNAKVDALGSVYFNSKNDSNTYVTMSSNGSPLSFVGKMTAKLHPGNARKAPNGAILGAAHSYIVTDILENNTKVQVMNDKGHLAEMSYNSFMQYVAQGLIISNAEVVNGSLKLLSKPLHEYLIDTPTPVIAQPIGQPTQQTVQPATPVQNTTRPVNKFVSQPAPVQPTVSAQPVQPTQKAQPVQNTNRPINKFVSQPTSVQPTPVQKPVVQSTPTQSTIKPKFTGWLRFYDLTSDEQTFVNDWVADENPTSQLNLELELNKMFDDIMFEAEMISGKNCLLWKEFRDAQHGVKDYNKWNDFSEQVITEENKQSGKLSKLLVRLTWNGKKIDALDYTLLYGLTPISNIAAVLDYNTTDLFVEQGLGGLIYDAYQDPRVWYVTLPNKIVKDKRTQLEALPSLYGYVAFSRQANNYSKNLYITVHPKTNFTEIEEHAIKINTKVCYGYNYDVKLILDLSHTSIRMLPSYAISLANSNDLTIILPNSCKRLHSDSILVGDGIVHWNRRGFRDKYIGNVYEVRGYYTYNERNSSQSNTQHTGHHKHENEAPIVTIIANNVERVDDVGYIDLTNRSAERTYFLNIKQANKSINRLVKTVMGISSLDSTDEQLKLNYEPVDARHNDKLPDTTNIKTYYFGNWNDTGKINLTAFLCNDETTEDINLVISGTAKKVDLTLIPYNKLNDKRINIKALVIEEGVEQFTLRGAFRLWRSKDNMDDSEIRIQDLFLPTSLRTLTTHESNNRNRTNYIRHCWYPENSVIAKYFTQGDSDFKHNMQFTYAYKTAIQTQQDMLTDLMGGSVKDAVVLDYNYDYVKGLMSLAKISV